jgi:hypothetical protein
MQSLAASWRVGFAMSGKETEDFHSMQYVARSKFCDHFRLKNKQSKRNGRG